MFIVYVMTSLFLSSYVSLSLCLCTAHDPSYALFLLGVLLDIFDDSCIPSPPLLSVPTSARVILPYGNLLLFLEIYCVILSCLILTGSLLELPKTSALLVKVGEWRLGKC